MPVFGQDESNILNLLTLIELDIDPDSEPDAGVCFDCIVTLEGFFQFKEQCHVNDDLIKSLPPEKVDDSDGPDEEEVVMPRAMPTYESSEEEGLVKDFDEITAPSKVTSGAYKPGVKRAKSKVAKFRKSRSALQFDQDELEKISKGLSIAELDRVQVIQDSYPDYFHFERRARSVYFTLVYYGERYNSATYNDNYTLWQCANRRRFDCPARVYVTNDYTEFERRFEHTHGEVIDNEQNDLYTPKQALPEVFKMCRQLIIRRKAKTRRDVLRKKMKRNVEIKEWQRNVQPQKKAAKKQAQNDNDSLVKVSSEEGEENELIEMLEYDDGNSSD